VTTDVAVDWRGRAACIGFQGVFFANDDPDGESTRRAKELCAGCQVSSQCLEFALETNQRAGIWGGATEDERRSLRRKWLGTRRRVG
jgi:WhiB family redox-sensing transcriptional regulator